MEELRCAIIEAGEDRVGGEIGSVLQWKMGNCWC